MDTQPSRPLARLAKICFWLALAFALMMALLPKPPAMPTDRLTDKTQHMIAFLVLTILAQVGFKAMPRWRLAERLSFIGAMIEVLQSIPALHRDCDIKDWIADTAVIVAVTALFALRHQQSIGRH